MDNTTQGIVDQPVSADEMAAIDQAASQYGAVVQPTSAMNNDDPAPTATQDEPVDPAPVADETPLAISDGGSSGTEVTDTVQEPVFSSPVKDDSSSIMGVVPPVETGEGTDEELLGVKQQALEQLTPIVDTLELPAEERFDTLMMIIRASDDKKLVKPAYEAANEISDKDKRARALLDVVNEVNYLTQNNPDQA